MSIFSRRALIPSPVLHIPKPAPVGVQSDCSEYLKALEQSGVDPNKETAAVINKQSACSLFHKHRVFVYNLTQVEAFLDSEYERSKKEATGLHQFGWMWHRVKDCVNSAIYAVLSMTVSSLSRFSGKLQMWTRSCIMNPV